MRFRPTLVWAASVGGHAPCRANSAGLASCAANLPRTCFRVWVTEMLSRGWKAHARVAQEPLAVLLTHNFHAVIERRRGRAEGAAVDQEACRPQCHAAARGRQHAGTTRPRTPGERLVGARGYCAYVPTAGDRLRRGYRPLELAPLGARTPQHAAPHTCGTMSSREPARGYLTGVANNPRSGWLEYFGCAPRERACPRVAS